MVSDRICVRVCARACVRVCLWGVLALLCAFHYVVVNILICFTQFRDPL